MTLLEMRTELLDALGYDQSRSSVLESKINTVINAAQTYVYYNLDVPGLRRQSQIATVTDQESYDWPADCPSEKVIQMAIGYNSQWRPLIEGIDLIHESQPGSGQPKRYRRTDKIQLWPKPDHDNYTLRIDYYRQPDRLINDTDALVVDNHAVFLKSLAELRLHLGLDGMDLSLHELGEYIAKQQRNIHPNRRYVRGLTTQIETFN
ncbi:phage adaptor protein [Magnetococcales bacterium HHB-1]